MPDSSAPQAAPPLWLLVLVTLSGTMAMHMFVPALPDAARGLGASAGAMQMAISLYVAGLAVGQLFYGPLSDSLGRRPMLLVGLALYTAAGLAAALAPGLYLLLGARLLQALGGCAGLALGRAMVRDTSHPETAVRQLAMLNLMVMVGPGLAPPIGGALAGAWGWRSVFVLLFVVGAATLAFAWRWLPETGRPTGNVGLRRVLGDYAVLLRSPRFVGLALGGGCATTSVYAFLAAAPFIFTHTLHQSVHAVGIYAGLLVLGMAAGNAITSRLSRRVPSAVLLRVGSSLSLASGVGLLVLVLAGGLSVASTMALMLLFTCGCGLASPAALAKAVSVDPLRIGAAAGLYGFSQMAVGAACTALAAVGGDPALAAAVVLVVAAVIAQVALTVALRYEPR
ncbi:multidrug effflux MFS transporter [Ramlibacter sp. G-1-2-2]|uniref:Bcr/CflA family efflux transporter n=1 Tax=Ramlibacter agri TaxID=2728837 RepID=A0A848H3K4_9BURK|nr:Bcr/CflA family efflux MFS transporter [Ramlibacter agri]NML45087.1 multidrug effflux MFS transporter [Ramlibacter agri]